MRRALFLFLAVLIGSLAAEAQSVVASGTGVQDGTGNLNNGGQWCFGATCLSVSSGAFSGSVTAGTQTVTIKNASSVTVFSLPNVVIPSGQPFNWNLYFVPANATVTATGGPYLPCFVGATWLAGSTFYCQSFAGQMAWGSTPTPVASGLISGFGAPTFSCTAPCSYIQINASPVTNAHWDLLAAPGTTSSNWVQLANSTAAVYPTGLKSDVQVAQTATWGTTQSGGTALTAVTTNDNDSFGYYVNVSTPGLHTFSGSINSAQRFNAISQAFKGTGTVGTCWGVNNNSGTSSTVTLSISPVGGSGHYVIAFARASQSGSSPITGIAFNDGNAYTNMLPVFVNSSTQAAHSNLISQGAYLANATGGTRTLTVTFSGTTAQYYSVYACEVSGLSGTDGPAQFTSNGTVAGGTEMGTALITSQANDFVFTGGTVGSTSATITAGLMDGTLTVTTLSSDPPFAAATDVGKEVFATTACDHLNGVQDCFMGLTMGVITAVGSAHSATVTSVPLTADLPPIAPAGNFTSWLLWGAAGAADDTAALQAAYNKALTVPGSTLYLPCGVMFISAPPFVSGPTGAAYNPNISGCGPSYGGTILVPTPLFNPNNVSTGLIVNYLANNSPQYPASSWVQNPVIWGVYSNFMVWGGGQDGSGVNATNPILYANTSKFQNVAVTGWLWNASVKLPVLQGAALIVDTVDGWAAGTDGLLINGIGPSSLETNYVTKSFFGVQAAQYAPIYTGFGLDVVGPGVFGNSGTSVSNTFNPGQGAAAFSCSSNLGMEVVGGSQWASYNDQIGGLLVNASSVWLDASLLSMLQVYGLCETAGSYVRAISSQIESINLASGTVFDDTGGGNYTCNDAINNVPCVAGSTMYSIWDNHRGSNSISGRVVGSLSSMGLNADSALANSNVGLTTNWGTGAAVSLAAGSSFAGSFKITEAGAPGASPVLTLTFPVPFAQAPSNCSIDQTAGNFTLSKPVTSSLTSTSVVFTWTGTPVNTDTYTFFYRCS